MNCQKMCTGNLYPTSLPFYLLIFGWNCVDECKYTCMHKVTEDALARGQDVMQFYGKVGHDLNAIFVLASFLIPNVRLSEGIDMLEEYSG